MKTKEEVISAVRSGDFKLSFSALKAFSESPQHFIRYKTGERKTTAAMKMGTLVHCLVLEPEKAADKYVIFVKPIPGSNMRKKENAAAFAEVQAIAAERGQEVVKVEDWNHAKAVADIVTNNPAASLLLSKCDRFEQNVVFEWEGFNWRGIIDANGFNLNIDLKKLQDANPASIKWKARREKWHWQAYLYARAINPDRPFSVKHFNVCVSEQDYGVSCSKISWTLLTMAEIEIQDTLERFRQCILNESLWDSNYEFWSDSGGYFEID